MPSILAVAFPVFAVIAPAVLFTVTRPPVGAFVMASQYGRYARETIDAIAATTALSIVTISAVLIVFA